MQSKTTKTIGWVLSGILAAFMLFSASAKFMTNPQMDGMIAAMGITYDTVRFIGVTEILCVVFFIIPRTGVLGTMLMTAYLGGAIATHIEHPVMGPPIAPVVCECVLWIAAALRLPELTSRLVGRG